MRRLGMVTAAVLAAGIMMSTTPATASPSVSGPDNVPSSVDVPCQGDVQGIGPAGDLRVAGNSESGPVGMQIDVPHADPNLRITAMGDVFTMWDDGVPDDTFDMTHSALVVSGGRLQRMSWTRLVTGIDPVTLKGGATTYTANLDADYGRGWGAMRSLHTAPLDWSEQPAVGYLYGFSRGTLYRYVPVRGGDGRARYRSAGKVSGFSAVRGIALVSSDSKNDQFLMTTTSGSLIRVTVPTAARMITRSVRLRSSGWAGYTTLVPARCEGKTGVVAITAGGQGRLFVLGRPNGLRTTIKAAPKVTDMRGWRVYASASQMP